MLQKDQSQRIKKNFFILNYHQSENLKNKMKINIRKNIGIQSSIESNNKR